MFYNPVYEKDITTAVLRRLRNARKWLFGNSKKDINRLVEQARAYAASNYISPYQPGAQQDDSSSFGADAPEADPTLAVRTKDREQCSHEGR